MSTQTDELAHADDGHGHDEHGSHASVGFYWLIGGILAALTGMEVGAYYMELGAAEVPLLLILSAAKFVLVVGFFMHLKFDSKVFTGVFVAGLVLAVFMVSALMVLYHWLPA
ncbi:MAG TPA: cytochrome C oxidase subunit IV family protein [Longimicrobiales bacterium]|nr:cytochrome C oxidase subunit IV family protein [Longimicrobiales bacterium]